MQLAVNLAALAATAWAGCSPVSVDFLMLEGSSQQLAIEEAIRDDLAEVGITAVPRFLAKDDLNTAMVAGDFDVVFSETWGAPYDPHSYVSSWTTPDEAHYPVMQAMDAPLDPTSFASWVSDILAQTDAVKRQADWTDLLSAVHNEVFHLPLWGKEIPSVTSQSRLEGYVPGQQQFDYPIHLSRVVSGSKNVTVAPGAQSGLFTTVGRLDPHSYRPNEFFSNNWVYEGLVSYGQDGAILPALASSWSIVTDSAGAETITFTLRDNVVFHDGAAFNCTVVKLNFDHFFAPPLRTPDWHGWYGLPGALDSWYCDGNQFVLTASAPYYPLLQELTYIRPTRILSPNAFVDGIDTSPIHNNSCPTGWGTVSSDDDYPTLTCAGILYPSGTGPWKFVSRDTNATSGYDNTVLFAGNADYWGGAPDIDYLTIVRYDTSADVKAALDAGDLDAVLGADVLDPDDVATYKNDADFEVQHTEPTQTSALIMNVANLNLNTRKTIVHAVNKVPIINNELGGMYEAVSQLFSENAPYCDVDLTPAFDYDLEKATLLNCPDNKKKSSDGNVGLQTALIILVAIVGAVACLVCAFACNMYSRELAGKPMFTPLPNADTDGYPKEMRQL